METRGSGAELDEVSVHLTKNRIVAVDITRIMAALIILYGHIIAWGYGGHATNHIFAKIISHTLANSSCIFFVFAGYFACRNITWKKAWNNAIWCFMPYMLWNIITLVFTFATGGDMHRLLAPPSEYGSTLEMCLSYCGFDGRLCIDSPLWFMRDLTILFLLSPILAKIARYLFPVLLCMSMFSASAHLFSHDMVVKHVCAPYSIAFFTLGCYIRSLSKGTQDSLLRYYSPGMLLAYFVVLPVCSVFRFVDSRLAFVLNESLIGYIFALWMLYQAARFLEEKVHWVAEWALKLAPVTFLTFAAHAVIYRCFIPECILHNKYMAVVPIIVFAALYAIFLFMKRYCRPCLHLVAHYKLRPDDLVGKTGDRR